MLAVYRENELHLMDNSKKMEARCNDKRTFHQSKWFTCLTLSQRGTIRNLSN